MLLGKAEGVVTLDISDLTSKVGMATSQLGMLDNAAGRFDTLDAQLQSVGTSTDRLGTGFVALGTAMLAPMAIGLKGAIDLEQSMKNVEVALGEVSEHDFSALSDQILEIGASGEFSAKEIAVVSEELAKAGFSIDQIMSGDPAAGFGNMAQAVSDLAAATGDGLGPAVEGIVVAMSTWKPEIVGVENAVTDATRAADIFTIAANESTAGVQDIISGMRNFGPTAALMGVGFDEAAAAIATFTNYGLTAREAGTSLTRTLVALADPTSEATETMNMLGISAFDLEGNFIGLPALMQQLNTNMKGMSEEARLAALSTIFGAEAMDVMGLAILGAGNDMEALLDIMAGGDGFVSAADQARERTNTLAGSLERLSEVSMTALAVLARGLIAPIRMVSETLDTMISAFVALPKPVTTAIGLVITSIGLLFVATGSFLLMGPRIVQFMQTARLMSQLPGILGRGATAFLMFGRAIRFMLLAGTGIGILVGAVAALVKLDLFGFGDAWRRAADAFRQANDTGNMLVGVLNAIAAALRSFDIGALNRVADVLTGLGTGWMAFWGGFNEGADAGTKQLQDAIDMSDLLISRIEDASGADGFNYLLMEVDVETGELEEVGQILESHDDPDDASRWWARVNVNGEEFEAWIDKETGEITHIPVEVDVTNPDLVPTMMDRIANGFVRIRDAGRTMRMDWLENFGQFGLDAVESINMARTAFDVLRAAGVNPVSAAFRSMAVAFEEMGWERAASIAGGLGRAIERIPFGAMRDTVVDLATSGFAVLNDRVQDVWETVSRRGRRAWNRFADGVDDAMGTVRFATNVFSNLIDAGINPVEAGLRTIGIVFPSLRGPIATAVTGVRSVIDIFRQFRTQGLSPLRAGLATVTTLFDSIDWSGIGSRIMDGLRSAFSSVGDVLLDLGSSILDGLSGISDSVGNWIADLFDTDEGAVGGGGKGVFGAAITDQMRDDLERAAKGAWERAWDNFRSWVSGRVEPIGNWVLDTGIPTVSGWLATAGDAAWESIKVLAGWSWDQRGDLGTITLTISGWVIEQSGDLLGAVRRRINSLLFGGSASGAGSLAGSAVGGGGSIDIGTVAAKIGEWVVLGVDDLHGRVDDEIERVLGEAFVFTVNIALDYAFELVGNPFDTLKSTLIVLGAAALASLLIFGGVTTALTLLGIVGLGLLAYYVVRQIMDYFEDNPLALERLQVRIGELWTELKESQIGFLFSGLEMLYNIIMDVVDALMALRNWLHNLPGPLGDAASAVEKLTLALSALFAVALMGGMGGKGKGGTGRIGFLSGLLRGLWAIGSFPFRMILSPIKTLKGLLDIGGKGSRGGRGAMGFLETLWGVIRLPFRAASIGIQAFASTLGALRSTVTGVHGALGAFVRGYTRHFTDLANAHKTFHGKAIFGPRWVKDFLNMETRIAAFRRGLSGMFRHIAHGKGPIASFVKALTTIDDVISPLTRRLSVGLNNILRSIPRMLAGDTIANAFRAAAPGIRRALFMAFNIAFLGIPGLLSGAVPRMIQNIFSRGISGAGIGSIVSRMFSPITRAIERFLLGGFRPSRGIMAGFFGGLFSGLTAIPSAIIRSLVPQLISGVNYLTTLFWRTLARAFGIDRAAALFNALGAIRAAIVRFFTPRGMGIIASPRAFVAFDTLAGMFDNLARRAGALRKIGGVFSTIGEAIARMVRPIGGVSGAFSRILGVAMRLSPVLRAIGISFAFFGIERGIAKLWDMIGGMDGIRKAWDRVKDAFAEGGMRGVIELAFNAIVEGIQTLASNLRESISNLTMADIWDWIKESAQNIDWKTVGTIIVLGLSLMIAGIPGILLGLVGVFLWEWLYDSLDGFDWGSLGSRLLSGIQSAFQSAWDWLNGPFEDFLRGPVADALRSLWDAIDWNGVGSAIVSGLKTAAQAAWDWLNGPFEEFLRSAVTGAWDWLKEKGAELIDSIVDGFNENVGKVTAWLGLLGDIVQAAVTGAWNWLREKGGELIRSIVDGFNEHIGTVTAWLGLLGGIIQAAVMGAWDWLKEKGKELLQSAVDGFNEGVSRVTAWLGQLMDIIMAAIGLGSAWNWLKAKGIELLQSAVDGFNAGIGRVTAWLGLLQDIIVAAVGGAWDWLKEKGSALIRSLRTGMISSWRNVSSWLAKIPSRIESLVPDMGDLLTSIGSGLWEGFKTGFSSAFEASADFFRGIGETIKGWIGTVADWFGLGGDDESVSADSLINIDIADLAQQIEQALADTFALRSGDILGPALSEFLQKAVRAAFMDIQLTEGITLGHQIAESIDMEVKKGIEVLSGDSLGGAISAWFGRAAALLPGKITTSFTGVRDAIDTAITTDIGLMSGSSLSDALVTWFMKARGLMEPLLVTGFTGIRNTIDTAITADLALNSGASLSASLLGWFMKALALTIAQLPTSVTGFRNAINDAVVMDIALMDGTGLGTALSGWFERAMAIALPLITTTLDQITMAFTTMVNATIALMGAWYNGVVPITKNAMAEMSSTIATANVSSTTSFESFVNTTIALMGAWYQGVTNIVSNAMERITESISSGAQRALRSIRSNFDEMVGAIRGSMNHANNIITAAASGWSGIILGYAGAMRSAGRTVGRAAGEGVVEGLLSMLGSVRSAANAIINEAMTAMRVAAEMRSPSRVTIYIAEMMGMGIVIGLRNMVSPVRQAANELMEAVKEPFLKPGSYWLKGPDYKALTGPMRKSRGGFWNPTSDNAQDHVRLLHDYLVDMVTQGEWLGDVLVHMPKELADAAMAFGRVWAPYLEEYGRTIDKMAKTQEWAARTQPPARENQGSSRIVNVTMYNEYNIQQQPGQDGEELSITLVRHLESSFDAVIGEG